MVRVGVMGATGYTGLELLRILAYHPGVEVCWVGSESFPGIKLEDYCLAWQGRSNLTLQKQEVDSLEGIEAIFLALPSGVAMDYVPPLLQKGIRVIDLGADFRFKNVEVFQKYYQLEHRVPHLLQEAVYGIPEICRERLKEAQLVANPGCYPTSVIIPLYPFLKEGVISPSIIVDSKSGVTGAGRKPTEDNQFCEVDENFKTYKVGEHRHQPEMKEQLELATGREVNLIFTPHLLPLKRGILTTVYLTLEKDIEEEELLSIWKDYWGRKPWVRIFPLHRFPELRWVVGSNFVDLGLKKVGENQLIVISALDNLIKGAAGQAVQNLNLMFGKEEKEGLPEDVLYP